MKAKYLFGAMLLSTLSVTALLIGGADGQPPPSDKATANNPADKGKEDRVRDTVITLKTSYSTVDLHESMNSDERFYVAPHFRFMLLEPDNKVIAQASRDAKEGRVAVHLALEMVHPQIRSELVTILQGNGRKVDIVGVRNLPVDSIRVGVYSPEDRDHYGVTDFVLASPTPGAEKLTVSLGVQAARSKEFVEAVNAGRITLAINYSYNQVSLDSRVEKLRASTLIDTASVRDLKQRGAEIMTAQQMTQVANGIKREIESKVYLGFGKIEPESLSVERLIQLFNVGKTWEMTEKQLEDLDNRARASMDLGINAKDFQPFKYQREVVNTLSQTKDVKQHKTQYASLYKKDKEKIQVSASAKGGGGFWSAKGSASYFKERERAVSEASQSDDEFKEHLEVTHGLKYTDQGVLERGVEVFDVQKIRSMGEMEIVSVTLKPSMGTGVRSLTVLPSQVSVAKFQTEQKLHYDLLRDEVKALKTQVDALKLKKNAHGYRMYYGTKDFQGEFNGKTEHTVALKDFVGHDIVAECVLVQVYGIQADGKPGMGPGAFRSLYSAELDADGKSARIVTDYNHKGPFRVAGIAIVRDP